MSFGSNLIMALICGTFIALLMRSEHFLDYWVIGVILCFSIQTCLDSNIKTPAQKENNVQ